MCVRMCEVSLRGCASEAVHLIFPTGLSLAWNSPPSRVGLLVGELQVSVCLSFPDHGMASIGHRFQFYVGSGDQTRVLLLVS